ncbi:MAG: glutathione S-transferase [Minwuia sp.]|nr:glutathione S-transferase [Minwuia sp.]
MKFYNSVGPNPRMVRIFMSELGVEIPSEDVDIRSGVNRQPEFLKINASGQCPALVLDDGTVIAEITAICEYLDDKAGGTSLIGTTPEERAETRMWTRRVDLNVCENLGNGFRYAEGLKMFESRFRCIPEAADGLKAIAQDKLTWLDGQLEGKQFLCGDRLTMADILLFAFVEFAAMVGQALNPDNKNIVAWFERMKARPSAAA